MSEASLLVRPLLSLAEVELRRDWLRATMRASPGAIVARRVEAVIERADASDPDAREALVSVALLFAAEGEQDWLGELRTEAEQQALYGLERMLRLQSPSSIPPPEPTAVPDYGRGRELTVGERRSLARQPNRRAFERLLLDPHPLVIRLLLGNPKLTENDVVRLIARRPVRRIALDELAQRSSWLVRPRVRRALVFQPGSPWWLVMPFLPLCPRPELVELVASPSLSGVVRTAACEWLERRPPLAPLETVTLH